jgi:peptide/nickel transport system substrate-binding protein
VKPSWRSTIRKPLGRRRAFALAAGGSLGLAAACGKNSHQSTGTGSPRSSGTPERGGTLGASWNANPPALDPQFFATGATTSFACAIMSGLFHFKTGPDPQVGLNHDLESELALSAESPDAVTWTIKLRTDARFHNIAPVNGHAVEAEDVKATFVRGVTSPQNPNRGVLGMVDPDAIETPAVDTVVFKLRYPYAPFANLLGSVQYGLTFPREVLSGGFDPTRQVIGSGPFLFDGYTPDVAVSLKRNADYFEKGLPYVDGVRHAILPATSLQLAQFTGGNLDSLVVGQNDVPTLAKAVPAARILKTLASGGGKAVYFQLGDPASPFQDIRLRHAVSLAVDRDAIGKTFYANEYDLSFSVQFLMGKWALRFNQLDPSVQQFYKFNLAQAKQLVEQAGGASLNLKFAYPAGAFTPDFDTLAQTVYSMLAALPWRVTLVPIDYNKDFIGGGKGYLYGNFPSDTLVFGGINTFTETDQYLYGYYHSKSTNNLEHLSDAQLDALIDRARVITDVEARRQAYLQAQMYIADKMYEVAGLPTGYTHTFVQSRVQNYGYIPETNAGGRSWSSLWLNA